MPDVYPPFLPNPDPITRPALTYSVGTSMTGIQQLITAGSQFTGAFPAGTAIAADGSGLTKYPTGTVGGLFDFGALQPIVAFLEFDFGGSVTYTVKIVNLTNADTVVAGESVTVATGSAAFYVSALPLRLTSRQAVQVTTSGATQAMVGRCKAILEHAFRG